MAELNFAELQNAAKAAGFSLVPPGEYNVEVETAELKTTSTEKQSINMMLRLIPGTNGDTKGTLWSQQTISPENPQALSIFFRQMKALGLDEKYFAANPPLVQVCQALVGRQCRVKVEHEKYDGQDRAKVKRIMPPKGGLTAVPSLGAQGSPIPQSGPSEPAAAASTPAVVSTSSKMPSNPFEGGNGQSSF